MVITDYTTYNDIRAALGVSSTDIDDTTLALALYSDHLQDDLETISLTLPETYTTVKAVVTPSDAQKRFLQAARLFSTYCLARQLTTSLPMFAVKQLSDSKATGQRFDLAYKDTMKQVNEQYDKMRNKLVQALSGLGTDVEASTARFFFGVVSPSVNVITNA